MGRREIVSIFVGFKSSWARSYRFTIEKFKVRDIVRTAKKEEREEKIKTNNEDPTS